HHAERVLARRTTEQGAHTLLRRARRTGLSRWRGAETREFGENVREERSRRLRERKPGQGERAPQRGREPRRPRAVTLAALVRSDRGATMVECAMIAGVVALLCLASFTLFGDDTKQVVDCEAKCVRDFHCPDLRCAGGGSFPTGGTAETPAGPNAAPP